jgi:putative membrane protein
MTMSSSRRRSASHLERTIWARSLARPLDKTLIPGAKNAQLKALLEAARPAFVQHLEHARHLQGTLAEAH